MGMTGTPSQADDAAAAAEALLGLNCEASTEFVTPSTSPSASPPCTPTHYPAQIIGMAPAPSAAPAAHMPTPLGLVQGVVGPDSRALAWMAQQRAMSALLLPRGHDILAGPRATIGKPAIAKPATQRQARGGGTKFSWVTLSGPGEKGADPADRSKRLRGHPGFTWKPLVSVSE